MLRNVVNLNVNLLRKRGLRQFAQSAIIQEKKNCWNCQHATACCTLFCHTCDAIQPIHSGNHCNYFELFNIPKNFSVEQRRMEQTYWNLQKKLHPDLYGSKSEFEKELSTVNSAIVNDAYKMLKTPNTRVKYLLALHGIDALSESSSTAVDPQILMQTMEIREQIDSICTLEELANVRQQVSHLIDDIIQRLAEVYDQRKDLEATKKLAVELQYMMKCAEEIEEKEEKLEATK